MKDILADMFTKPLPTALMYCLMQGILYELMVMEKVNIFTLMFTLTGLINNFNTYYLISNGTWVVCPPPPPPHEISLYY
jgi:hypothetical protein